MSEHAQLAVNVTLAVFGGILLLGIVGAIVDRVFARHER